MYDKKNSDELFSIFKTRIENIQKKEFESVLPKEINVDRFIRALLTSTKMKPELFDCDVTSLFYSCMCAAKDGLLLDGREAVLNVYTNKRTGIKTVTYLPMYQGLMRLARDSGEILYIDAAVVYDKDHFKFQRGDDPKIEHVPYDGKDSPGAIKAAYMIARLKGGFTHREVMFRRDLDKVKNSSSASTGFLWTTWEDQASIKSVLRRGLKMLPRVSDRLASAAARGDDDFEELDQPTPAPKQEPKQITNQSSRLSSIIGKKTEAATVENGQNTQGN